MPTRAASIALMLASLALLRLQIVSDLGLQAAKALPLGLRDGLVSDLTAVLWLYAIAMAIRAAHPPAWRPLWTLLSAFLYIAALANTLYFRFFSSRLDWWVVRHHWRDLFTVGDSAGTLGLTWPVAASVPCFLAASALVWVPRRRAFITPRRLSVLAAACGIALAAAAMQLHPIRHKWDRPTSVILADQVLGFWGAEWFRIRTIDYEHNTAERRRALKEALPKVLTGGDRNPAGVLAAFRDWRDPERGTPASDEPDPGAAAIRMTPQDPGWPLLMRAEPVAPGVRALRARLGLPVEGPINVMMFFLESVRTLELLHPEIGPKVLPRVRAFLDAHAILFTQAYSSAITAGQTVRGEFATMCSQLSNVGGAAEYVAHPAVRVKCLQGTFRENGHRSLWMSGFAKSFHNKYLFESLHGTEEFFDEPYFRSKGITQRIGAWGLADAPVLGEVLRLMEARHAAGEKLFTHFITISTHHPHSVIPLGPLPEGLMTASAAKPEYQAYLSRLKYADDAIGGFLEAFLKSPIARDTLIVLVGDHGITTEPHMPLADLQRKQMPFRIPVAFVSAGITAPARLSHPIHQADVAPTVAAIAGVGGTVTWLGRNVFSGEGTPWLYQDGHAIAYRTASRVCHTHTGQKKPRCWLTGPGSDPLFDPKLPAVPEDADQTRFFLDVLAANREAIIRNGLAPP